MRFWLAIVVALSTGPAAGQAMQTSSEEIRFETAKSVVLSADHSKWEFGKPQALSGKLFLPKGVGPFPLVVLAHGCDGITPVEVGWSTVLNSWGYATFILDSLTDRNLEEVCTNAADLRPIQRVPDAYGALNALSQHTKIDANRSVLMGFSHGGALALSAAMTWSKQQFTTGRQPTFRAFEAFYPANCNVDYPERKSLYAPVRIHVGALDDWTPAAQCERLVKEWKAAKQDADITSYAGAYHAFDYEGLGLTHLSYVDNGAGCTVRFPSVMGPFAPPVEGAGCVTKGATVAGNREATEKAEKLVRTQLAHIFK
ncbi:MAG: dienelactone hydrolase family protein [Pseudomonadota bacterium]